MNNEEKPRYAILFRKADAEKLSRESGSYTLPVVTVNEDNQPRNGSGDWNEDLVFETFVYLGCNGAKPEFCQSKIEYSNAYRVNLRRAETMLKVLKRAERALEKLPIKPTDFAQYVVLLGKALGIDYVICDNQPELRHSWYSDSTYTVRPIRDAQELISYEFLRVLTAFEERSAQVA